MANESFDIAQSKHPKQTFRFRVFIANSLVQKSAPSAGNGAYSPSEAKFSEVGPLRARLKTVRAPSGGRAVSESYPTGLEFADITLTRGMTNDLSIMAWLHEAAEAGMGLQDSNSSFKRSVVINELDLDEVIINRWHLVRAFPIEVSIGPYSGDGAGFLLQRVILRYHSLVLDQIYTDRVNPRPVPRPDFQQFAVPPGDTRLELGS